MAAVSVKRSILPLTFSDVHGQTPLHYAALQGSKRSAELILASKPESLNVTDKIQVRNRSNCKNTQCW